MISKIKTNSREEWLALRKNYVGGSDAASVVGLNPYGSAYQLWAEKTGRIPGFEGNLATKVGTYLEEFVAKLFEEETGKKVKRDNQSFVNDQYPFAIADIDRAVIGENAGLEIKTCSALSLKRFKGGDYPSNYYVQCMHYLAVTGKDKWYLAVLIGNSDFRIFEIERDQAEIDALMAAEEQFWESVKNDTAPNTDGSDATSATISALYPYSNKDESVNLEQFKEQLKQRAICDAQIKELKAVKDSIDNSIKDFMKTAEKGICEGYTVSFATQNRRSFDTEAFAEAHKDTDLTPYYKTSTSRVFKITAKKEKK